jgi:hypothetical protein
MTSIWLVLSSLCRHDLHKISVWHFTPKLSIVSLQDSTILRLPTAYLHFQLYCGIFADDMKKTFHVAVMLSQICYISFYSFYHFSVSSIYLVELYIINSE